MSHTRRKPSRIRFAVFIFLGVYPLVTVLGYLAAPLTIGWEGWQRNLVTVPVIVVAMVWVIVPTIQGRLAHLL